MSKKLVQINTVCNGSTGRIMQQIQEEAENSGYDVYNFFGRGKRANVRCIKICNKLDIFYHVLITRLFDRHGYGCKYATKRLVKKLKQINPDIIQLHNIHGYYINLKILFKYLKTCNAKIVWTLHDCWSFTGHCPHFTYVNCTKWKKECKKCPQKDTYPKSLIDNSKKNYKLKKELFTKIENLTIVTPSKWLADLVKESFLAEYEIEVINNGIDLNVFKPAYDENIYEKYNIPKDKKIILGVASVWTARKGLNEFIKLNKMVDFNKYVIVLVGLNKKQIKTIPSNIIGIERTENAEELAKLYTISDIFLNPSKEETFSLVTVEAMCCGIPVIVYDNSAVKEVVGENGKFIKQDTNIKDILDVVINDKSFNKNRVILRNYDVQKMKKKYIELYRRRV